MDWELAGNLISGYQKKIEAWRYDKAIELTMLKRPELLKEDDVKREKQLITLFFITLRI